MKEEAKYVTIYNKTADTEVYYHSLGEDIRGFLSGMREDDILEVAARIHNCFCGGMAELHELEGMGETDYMICCKKCDRTLSRNPYDVDLKSGDDLLDICIRDWNAGLSSEDIKRRNDEEHDRIRLRKEDLSWKKLYPNNMPCNGLEGYYSLVFKRTKDGVYCCKWTIEYQLEEVEPGMVSFDSPIEAYNLYMQRFFQVQGPMCYPEPDDKFSFMDDAENENTFFACGVNDYGEFVRSYRTLEDAQMGAVARCAWQGLNRDTILREAEC